jgi:hypothetical protein
MRTGDTPRRYGDENWNIDYFFNCQLKKNQYIFFSFSKMDGCVARWGSLDIISQRIKVTESSAIPNPVTGNVSSGATIIPNGLAGIHLFTQL